MRKVIFSFSPARNGLVVDQMSSTSRSTPPPGAQGHVSVRMLLPSLLSGTVLVLSTSTLTVWLPGLLTLTLTAPVAVRPAASPVAYQDPDRACRPPAS